MIRILHVVGKMDRGGMETLIMNYYRNIDRENFQFDFLVHYQERGAFDDEIENLGGRIYRMPRTNVENYYTYKKALNKFFKEHKEYKIIHGHLIETAFLYHSIAKKYGEKCCITHAHSTSVQKNLKGYLGYITAILARKYTDVYFTCSNAAAKFYFGNKIMKENKIVLLKNSIDVNKFKFNSDIRDKVRCKLDISDKFVIGHIGRFSKDKNHTFIIDIFNEVYKLNKDSVLILIGAGPLEEEISEKVKKMKLEKNIKLLGVRSDVSELLQGLDIFLLPSLFEGLPVVGVEAQASGVRCFMSNKVPYEVKITDLVEFIDIKKSSEYWAKKILEYKNGYFRDDESEKIRLNGYDVKNQVNQLEEFYSAYSKV